MDDHAEYVAEIVQMARRAARKALPHERDEVFSLAQAIGVAVLKRYREDCGHSFGACLNHSVRIGLIDELRHRTRKHAIRLHQCSSTDWDRLPLASFEDQIERDELVESVRKAVDRLEVRERQVILFDLGMHQPGRTIAEDLGVSDRTILRIRARAFRQLRRMLEPTYEAIRA